MFAYEIRATCATQVLQKTMLKLNLQDCSYAVRKIAAKDQAEQQASQFSGTYRMLLCPKGFVEVCRCDN